MNKSLVLALLALFWANFATAQDIPVLDLKKIVRSRVSKQFKDTLFKENTNDGGNVAMSLVDALQNWADALEAQISMMKTEVLELKTSNRKLSDEVTALRSENGKLSDKVGVLEETLGNFKGETMDHVQDDIRVMSNSFGDFIDHFNDFTISVMVNFTTFNQSMISISENNENLDEGMKNMRLEHKVEREEIEQIKDKIEENQNRITQIVADNAALGANLQLTLYNTTMAFFADVQAFKGQAETFQIDIQHLKDDFKILNAQQNFIANETETLRENVLTSMEVIQLEVVAMQKATEATLKPLIESMNNTLLENIGKMEANVSKLNMADQDLQQGVFKLNAVVSSNTNSLHTQVNMTLALQDQLITLATTLSELQGNVENTTKIFTLNHEALSEMSIYNSTLLQRGFFSLEKYFIEMKKKLFETELEIVTLNATLVDLGSLRSEVVNIGQTIGNTTALIADRFEDVSSTTMAIQSSLSSVWNATNMLNADLSYLKANHTNLSGILQNGLQDAFIRNEDLQTHLYAGGNKTMLIESGLTGLLNYTLDLDRNLMGVKANVSRVNMTLSMSNLSLGRLFNLYELQGERVTENTNVLKNNVTKFSIAANILEAELSRVAAAYTGLKNALSRHISNSGNIEVNVQKLMTESIYVKGELDSIKYEVAGVKAEATGVTVFVTSIQKHVGELLSNMTEVHQNMTFMDDSIEIMQTHLDQMDESIDINKSNVTRLVGTMGQTQGKVKDIESGMETMKTNVIGLGSYINSINSDMGNMLSSFDVYAKKMNKDMTEVKSNMTELHDDYGSMMIQTEDMRKTMDSMGFSTTTLRADVTELTTKMYNLKTTAFEQSNEISNLKTNIDGLENNLAALLKELSKLRTEENIQNSEVKNVKVDMNNVKKSMTSLSAAILELKSKFASSHEMDQRLAYLYTNITTIRTQLTTVRESLTALGPDMDLIHSDMDKFRTDVNELSTELAVMADPARFSCAVTTDEIREPGVITYSTCNVNANAMMNKNTGHITVRDPGDYFLSFTANMVSVNSQAIWCAIYKQSPGSDGWQVLGKNFMFILNRYRQ